MNRLIPVSLVLVLLPLQLAADDTIAPAWYLEEIALLTAGTGRCAPHVEPDAVGSATFPEAVARKGVPMVVESGIYAYTVTFTDGSSESDDVVQNCAGNLYWSL